MSENWASISTGSTRTPYSSSADCTGTPGTVVTYTATGNCVTPIPGSTVGSYKLFSVSGTTTTTTTAAGSNNSSKKSSEAVKVAPFLFVGLMFSVVAFSVP